MSKQAKIIIFSVILFASFLMKHCNDDGSYKKPSNNKFDSLNDGNKPSSVDRKTTNTFKNLCC